MTITLSHSDLELRVATLGAEMTSLSCGGHDFLWNAGPAWPRHAPVLFPIVGRLKDDTAFIQGRPYRLTQHGFARDMEFTIENQSASEAVLRLTHTDQTLKQFPFRFVLQIEYSLWKDGITVRYVVTNEDSSVMWFSIGGHPAFACPPGNGPYRLEFDRDDTAERYFLDQGLQSGRRERMPTSPLEITPSLFDQDALIFKNLHSKAVTLTTAAGQRVLTLSFEGFPYFGVWSKPGAPFVCLEPWFGVADSQDAQVPFESKEGIMALETGRSFVCQYSIQIHR